MGQIGSFISKEELIILCKNSKSFEELYNKIITKVGNICSKKTIIRYIKKNKISYNHFDYLNRDVLWSKKDIQKCIINAETYSDIITNLGQTPCTSTYNKLHKCLLEYNISFGSNYKKIPHKWLECNLRPIVLESTSNFEVIIKLGLSTNGNNNKTLSKYIKKYNIDTDHYTIRHNIGKSLPLCDILVEESKYNGTSNLKKRLYKEGLKERKCELCGQDEEWNGKHMSLILDHINGVNNDNRIENLQIVCANCNATLPTHCRGYKKQEKKKYYCKCGNTKSRKAKYCKECKEYRTEDFKQPITNYCECGKEIKKSSKMCEKCYKLSIRKVERPPYEQLLKEIEETNYSTVGRKYSVSDNAIRKWIKNYEKNNEL